ncbi:site-specific integrase [Quadrisphaera sp. INWT6]|nr:site-specific integrase [Quadrisphaera sp. INWT6]
MSIARRADGKWRARYRGPGGREVARHFDRKADAQQWLDEVMPVVRAGGDPLICEQQDRTTVAQWGETWLEGHGANRTRTVRQARVHLAHINAAFGDMPLREVKPSHVRAWVAALKKQGFAPSYVYSLHRRLSQIMTDAIHDELLDRNPCSRRTSPRSATQRPFVPSTEQVWALHDAFPGHLRPAVLLGAFVGLRTGEACGLRVQDLDVERGLVNPMFQYPQEPLKGNSHRTSLPVPPELMDQLVASVQRWGSDYVVSDGRGRQICPRTIDRAMIKARREAGLPKEFRFHDLRHYLASLLISQGLDVKVVQYRLRHAAATTTLNVYAHLWPESDESARAVIGEVMAQRAAQPPARSRADIAAQAITAHHQRRPGLDPGGPIPRR